MGLTKERIRDLKFLGLASYYKKFIQGFSSTAVPLTSLTKKNVKFMWSPDCQKSFDTLKKALITAPVLVMPSGQGNFVLYSDTSKLGLGVRRWLELVKDYDCDISYHPRKANVVDDALSRKSRVIAQLVGTETSSARDAEIQSRDRIPSGQSSDEQFQKWRTRDKSKSRKIYAVSDGIVSYRGKIWSIRYQQGCSNLFLSLNGNGRMLHGFRSWFVEVSQRIKRHLGNFSSSYQVGALLADKDTFSMTQYAELYIWEIVRLHGIPVIIISDRGPRFTYPF
ncbi:uncharacterized protein LOC142504310 [Primulina tabacum]|uniref:uncharacterized protein LOC142504310 n=1 Tax=Primulina tabacum TaxID=48773 RepID=UPI003F5A3AAB